LYLGDILLTKGHEEKGYDLTARVSAASLRMKGMKGRR
jgi:hypothetical protein